MASTRWVSCTHLLLPLFWLLSAGHQALGSSSVDLEGHLWVMWNATQGSLTHSSMVNWPEGLDLLPVLGGWLDVMLGAPLVPVLGLIGAYNAVVSVYMVCVGLGGHALATALGVRAHWAWVAGVLLQLDGFVLHHLTGGRPEQLSLGLVALALAALLRTWREPRWSMAFLCGLAGAALVYASWEMAMSLAMLLLLLLPALLVISRPPGLLGKLALAAGTAVLLAGPWMVVFLAHALAARSLDEGSIAAGNAAHASVALIEWLRPGQVRPGYAAMLCLPLLCWTVPAPERRLWAVLGMLLLLSLLLALGPSPRFYGPPASGATWWSPFALLQELPVLGWFHWPDRLLWGFSLASAVAAALLLRKLSENIGRATALGLAALLLLAAGSEAWLTDRWPRGRFGLANVPWAQELAMVPGPGAVLDLPPMHNIVQNLDYQLLQLRHGRPILFNMFLPHLVSSQVDARLRGDPVLSWFLGPGAGQGSGRKPFSAGDFQGLRDLGFRFVVLHRRRVSGSRWKTDRDLLLRSLGQPGISSKSGDWMCWDLDGILDKTSRRFLAQ